MYLFSTSLDSKSGETSVHEIDANAINEIPAVEGGMHTVELACVCGKISCGYSVKDMVTAKKFAFEYWWRHKVGDKSKDVFDV